MRLQRVLADAGVAARRVCEELIEAGRVAVNGRVMSRMPVFVDPDVDRITVDGRPLPERERKVYVMLNKPARVLSASADEPGAGRRTVLDLVSHPDRPRLFPVGRLGYDASGLVLLTNDGPLANRLTHPRYGVTRTYRAVVTAAPEDRSLRGLEREILKASRFTRRQAGRIGAAGAGLTVIERTPERSLIDITLREGKNEEVSNVLARAGCRVKKLERTAIGPLRLSHVAPGKWRELEKEEVRALRDAAKAEGGGPPPSAPRPKRPPRTQARRQERVP